MNEAIFKLKFKDKGGEKMSKKTYNWKKKIALVIEVEDGMVQDVRFAKAKDEKEYELEYELIDHDIDETQ